MNVMWRESASLILAAKTTFGPFRIYSDYNYKLLMLKRSEKSSFMPGAYVFPGGNIDKADSSRNWLNLYESYGFNYDTFDKLNPKENKVSIYNDDQPKELPKFLSLRISAIRETFEESGILICRSYKINYKERNARWASYVGGCEMKQWQQKVHENPEEFYKLCKEYEIYPDVWALKEWSNWKTPPIFNKRFNTIFFFAAFHQTPAARADKSEVEHLEWRTPKEYLESNETEEAFLAPPQFYELSRLTNFKDVDAIQKFATERSIYGSEEYLPHIIKTDEDVYSILPGDDLYPKNIDELQEITQMKSLPPTFIKNRIWQKNQFCKAIITANFKPKYNHINPLNLRNNL